LFGQTPPGQVAMPSISALTLLLLVSSTIDCAAQRVASNGTAAATTPRWCRSSNEARAIACSAGTARRSGDTLFIRLDHGSVTKFIEVVGEAPGGYHYVGRVGARGLHIVRSEGFETPPSWLFVDPRDGRRVASSDEPLYSPDGTRFVTAAEPDWNNCTERDRPGMDVWRFTDSLPVLEWRLDPWDCRTETGWGPTEPRWRGSDTIEFVRNDMRLIGDSVLNHQRPMRAVRGAAGWRVATPQ
jgi:hypothetical protein